MLVVALMMMNEEWREKGGAYSTQTDELSHELKRVLRMSNIHEIKCTHNSPHNIVYSWDPVSHPPSTSPFKDWPHNSIPIDEQVANEIGYNVLVYAQ